jgi:hypothetical protein
MHDHERLDFLTVPAFGDECAIRNGPQQAQWFERMKIRVDTIASSLRWKYEMGDSVLSASSKFRFICRAKVSWVTEDGIYQTVQTLWENKVGQTGSMSTPVEEMAAEQTGRMASKGTDVHLFDRGPSEWLRDLRGADNDN